MGNILVILLHMVKRTTTPLVPLKKGLKKFIVVDGGIRTHDPKAHSLPTTAFVKVVVVGY